MQLTSKFQPSSGEKKSWQLFKKLGNNKNDGLVPTD